MVVSQNLINQMRAGQAIGNYVGLRDASDWIRYWMTDRKVTERDLDRPFYDVLKRHETQVQYGCTEQLRNLAAIMNFCGFNEASEFIYSLIKN